MPILGRKQASTAPCGARGGPQPPKPQLTVHNLRARSKPFVREPLLTFGAQSCLAPTASAANHARRHSAEYGDKNSRRAPKLARRRSVEQRTQIAVSKAETACDQGRSLVLYRVEIDIV
eukprot:scaffold1638_cov258-Pinguiococcus_pyrenoidosus.AAC.99